MASPPPGPPPSSTLATPENAWFSVAGFLAVVGIFQWGSVLHSKLAKQRRPPRDSDEESTHSSITRAHIGGGWSLTRLPLAVVNVFRVIAFRWALEVGTYDLKVADILLTLGYVAFLLAWTFLDGKSWSRSSSRVCRSFLVFRSWETWRKSVQHTGVERSRRPSRGKPAPACYGSRYKEQHRVL